MKTVKLDERYSRQIRLPEIGEEGQERLARATVAIIGSGTLGCFLAANLCRAGVARLKIIDRDYVERSNLQSQLLFCEQDVRERYPKAMAAMRHLHEINSTIAIEPFLTDLNPWNIIEILNDCDLILDGTDNFETRFLLNDFSIKHGTPWIYISALGTSGMTMNVIPEETACLRCLLPTPPSQRAALTCETAGILAMAAHFVASLGATEALKILLHRREMNDRLISIDVWRGEIRKTSIERDSNCPACSLKRFEFLEDRSLSTVVKICGRDMFQISPAGASDLSLAQLAERLAKAGSVERYKYLVKVQVPEGELTLFGDGRALIKGAKTETEAKSLYARYIGM